MNSTKFSIRWTDEVLLYILVHAKGDFNVALETILRHEATGQPPELAMATYSYVIRPSFLSSAANLDQST